MFIFGVTVVLYFVWVRPSLHQTLQSGNSVRYLSLMLFINMDFKKDVNLINVNVQYIIVNLWYFNNNNVH